MQASPSSSLVLVRRNCIVGLKPDTDGKKKLMTRRGKSIPLTQKALLVSLCYSGELDGTILSFGAYGIKQNKTKQK